jgi:hypothetical protein
MLKYKMLFIYIYKSFLSLKTTLSVLNNFPHWKENSFIAQTALSQLNPANLSFPQATTGVVPIGYRRALLSNLLHIIV